MWATCVVVEDDDEDARASVVHEDPLAGQATTRAGCEQKARTATTQTARVHGLVSLGRFAEGRLGRRPSPSQQLTTRRPGKSHASERSSFPTFSRWKLYQLHRHLCYRSHQHCWLTCHLRPRVPLSRGGAAQNQNIAARAPVIREPCIRRQLQRNGLRVSPFGLPCSSPPMFDGSGFYGNWGWHSRRVGRAVWNRASGRAGGCEGSTATPWTSCCTTNGLEPYGRRRQLLAHTCRGGDLAYPRSNLIQVPAPVLIWTARLCREVGSLESLRWFACNKTRAPLSFIFC